MREWRNGDATGLDPVTSVLEVRILSPVPRLSDPIGRGIPFKAGVFKVRILGEAPRRSSSVAERVSDKDVVEGSIPSSCTISKLMIHVTMDL